MDEILDGPEITMTKMTLPDTSVPLQTTLPTSMTLMKRVCSLALSKRLLVLRLPACAMTVNCKNVCDTKLARDASMLSVTPHDILWAVLIVPPQRTSRLS